jgi:hypothetical protein
MVSQAHLIVSTEPLIAGGIERTRELLDMAEQLADFMLSSDGLTAQSHTRLPKWSRNGK